MIMCVFKKRAVATTAVARLREVILRLSSRVRARSCNWGRLWDWVASAWMMGRPFSRKTGDCFRSKTWPPLPWLGLTAHFLGSHWWRWKIQNQAEDLIQFWFCIFGLDSSCGKCVRFSGSKSSCSSAQCWNISVAWEETVVLGKSTTHSSYFNSNKLGLNLLYWWAYKSSSTDTTTSKEDHCSTFILDLSCAKSGFLRSLFIRRF